MTSVASGLPVQLVKTAFYIFPPIDLQSLHSLLKCPPALSAVIFALDKNHATIPQDEEYCHCKVS
jgi:hypothetical protein